MSNISKYNIYKGVSSVATFGTPIVTLACCGDFLRHRSETTISAAGLLVLILVLFFVKDKIFDNFKTPPAVVLSFLLFIFIVLIEHIILPMKIVCIATMIVSGVDEITFKQWYKRIEKKLPEIASDYKHAGFIFAKTKTIMETKND